MSQTVYLSLGSNLGDREANLARGLEMISALEGFELIKCSSIYITKPLDMDESAPFFLNMVIKGEFAYTPLELLGNTQRIERELGRTGKGAGLPRPLDIDILLWGEEKIMTARLTVPHPRMADRGFVMVPLLEMEPELVDPVTGRRLAEAVEFSDAEDVILYKECDRHYA